MYGQSYSVSAYAGTPIDIFIDVDDEIVPKTEVLALEEEVLDIIDMEALA